MRGEGSVRKPGGKRPLIARARQLRRKSTFSERRLWETLRGKRLEGLRFRRQQPIGPYVADFFCPSAKLVVELDGYFHNDPLRVERDEARTAWLRERGYRALRFRNEDDLSGVLAAIAQAAGVSQLGAERGPPPPEGRGEAR
jgi:very-short-patch-repair endonuclease